MAGLNMGALKGLNTTLAERKKGGDVIRMKDITAEYDCRLAQPHPSLGGVYYCERSLWWINEKPYVDPITFGGHSVIEDEVKEAWKKVKAGDKGLETLLKDKKKFKKASSFYIGIMALEVKVDDENNPIMDSIKVIEDKIKVLDANPTMMEAINAIVTSRTAANGTEWGIIDRVQGRNLILTRKGEGLDTKYGALMYGTPSEMPAKYYKEDALPDLIKMVKAEIPSDIVLRSAIRNYLYGEPLIEAGTTNQPAVEAQAEIEHKAEATSSAKTGGAASGGRTRGVAVEPNVSDDAGAPETKQEEKATPGGKAGGRTRNVAADMADIDA